ncbi:MAG TPA: preprotein translocase subunit SecG [Alphaproteobacteria bacterium]
MTAVFLVLHVMLAISLVIVVLLQRSDGGALGGLGGGSFGGVMSGRQSANLLTRTTAVLAAGFMGTSLVLAILASGGGAPSSILDTPASQTESAPPAPVEDSGTPSAPLAR